MQLCVLHCTIGRSSWFAERTRQTKVYFRQGDGTCATFEEGESPERVSHNSRHWSSPTDASWCALPGRNTTSSIVEV